MDKNPEMRQKMMQHMMGNMQEMMKNNPQMKQRMEKMQSMRDVEKSGPL